MKIRMRNPEFPLYFIGELGFGIFLFLDSPYKVISLKEKCIMILICDHLEYCIYDFANAYYYHG